MEGKDGVANDIDIVDIYADGYVQNASWGNGWNFGTPFATPRELNSVEDQCQQPLIEKQKRMIVDENG